jgi:cation transport regulator
MGHLASSDKEDAVPYAKVSDLPEAQVDQYTEHQKHAFLKAFNNALDEYGDEGRAFATAHAAAQRAPRDEPDDERDETRGGRD